MVVGERGGEAVLPRPVRIEVVLHREIPLDTPLRAEVTPEGGAWYSRILRDDRPIVEAWVRPAAAPLAALSADLRRLWDGAREEAFTVPGYEFCLGCGFRNPRGAQVRFECDDHFVWKWLEPQTHFRCEDGSLFPGYHIVVGDELGWWMGALRQGECGLSSSLVVTLGEAVPHGTPLLALGPRAAVRTSDPKGRIWQTQAMIVTIGLEAGRRRRGGIRRQPGLQQGHAAALRRRPRPGSPAARLPALSDTVAGGGLTAPLPLDPHRPGRGRSPNSPEVPAPGCCGRPRGPWDPAAPIDGTAGIAPGRAGAGRASPPRG